MRWLCVVLLLLLADPAWSAIAYIASANSGIGGSVSSISWSVACTACDVIVATCHSRDDDAGQIAISGVTYNAVALEKARHDTNAGLGWQWRTEIWYLAAPATGTNTMEVSYTGNTNLALCSAHTFSGVDQGTPIEASNGANGTSTTPTANVTTVTDQAWVVDSLIGQDTGSLTAGSGQTEREKRLGANCGNVDSWSSCGASTEGPVTPAGSVTMSWTMGASLLWVLTAAALKPAGAGGGVMLRSGMVLGVGP